ncbi:MAG: sugar phosphate isomerase/epimerase [Lentisphaerae bacterium]|jgi:sugar phosphate isomerase/epimerase|nr:sugar phosphate isomerase/epimerase [Lentisphaerota bacterium]
MKLGVVSRSFPKMTTSETAEFMAQNGFVCTELCFAHTDANYWSYNGRRDLSSMTDERSQMIVEAFRSRGIEVSSLGVFTNLINPDASERAANLAYFERLMQIAAFNGIPCVATECGFTPGQRGINTETYERDFNQLVESLKWLVEKAGHYDLEVALEPCIIDVVPSAKRTADLIKQVGSDRLRVLLDPANLIPNNTEEEMFHHLASKVAYFHGKDRKVNDVRGRALGDGDIDWPLFLSLYHRHAEGLPFILEYVGPDDVLAIRDRVLQADAAARKLVAAMK